MDAELGDDNQEYDSDVTPEERRHMAEQRRQLQILRPEGEDTVHVCRPCDINYDLPSRLNAHQVYKHNSEDGPRRSKVPCPMCRRVCRSQKTMALHLGTHIGERRCFRCGAEFASARAALFHELMPLDPLFQCSVCKCLFVTKSQRDEHHRMEHA